jgi:hypothetical protein
MIESAEEFVRLRTSDIQAEYDRAALEEVPEAVCLDVIARYPHMRRWIAHNKTVPLSVLWVLAADPDPGVRSRVAMKRKADPELLHVLAKDPDEGVRERVAYNAKAPRWILEMLVDDPVERIAERARERLAGP